MDDFFTYYEPDDQNKKEKKKTMNAYTPPSNKKKGGNKVVLIVVAIALSLVMFLAGGASVWFMLDKEIRTLVKVKHTIDKQYYKEIDDEEFYGAIFDAVNGQLDPYSGYMTADEFQSSVNDLNGRRIGIGVSFSSKEIEENGRIRIALVCGNSPAEAAGLTAGSYITGFGRTETEITESEVYAEFTAFLAEFGESEPFYLQIRTGEEKRVACLTKEAYVESYVFYRSSTTAYGFTGDDATTLTEKGAPLTCLDDDTAYIRLVRFGGAAVEEFDQAMALFKREGKKNLVLDLRSNGGGYLNTMQGIASYFCKGSDEKYPTAAIADYGEGKKEYYLAAGNYYDDYFAENSRICVLADGGSASASECLIGVMVDYGATSYGDICLSERGGVAKSYGKGIMQQTFYMGVELDALKLTTAEIRWPVTGYSIHGRGVLPEDGTKTVKEGVTDEEELAAAIAALFG